MTRGAIRRKLKTCCSAFCSKLVEALGNLAWWMSVVIAALFLSTLLISVGNQCTTEKDCLPLLVILCFVTVVSLSQGR